MNKTFPLFLIGLAMTLSACASPLASQTDPDGSIPVESAPETSPTACTEVSNATLNAVNETVIAADDENSLPDAVALHDQDSGLWIIAGAFAGPAGQGDGAIGIWATDGDVSSSNFEGKVWAVDGGARQFSVAEYPSAVNYDPENVPVLGCWSQHQ